MSVTKLTEKVVPAVSFVSLAAICLFFVIAIFTN